MAMLVLYVVLYQLEITPHIGHILRLCTDSGAQ
jgi:tRNA(Leu) C34 or U34 (ribose-2'-O)-methylase TrmL